MKMENDINFDRGGNHPLPPLSLSLSLSLSFSLSLFLSLSLSLSLCLSLTHAFMVGPSTVYCSLLVALYSSVFSPLRFALRKDKEASRGRIYHGFVRGQRRRQHYR